MLTFVGLFILIAFLLRFERPIAALLDRLPGYHSVLVSVGGFLIVLTLLITLNPELRAALFVVDFLGIDVFLVFLLIQGQHVLQWMPVLGHFVKRHFLDTSRWYPLPVPNRITFKHRPWWSLGAQVQLLAVAFVIAIPVGIAARSI